MPPDSAFATFDHVEFARRRMAELARVSLASRERDAAVEQLARTASHAWCLWVAPRPDRPALLICGEWTLSAFVLQGLYSQVELWETDEGRAGVIDQVANEAGVAIEVHYCRATDWPARLTSTRRNYGLAAMQQALGLLPRRSPQRREVLAALSAVTDPGGQSCVVSRNQFAATGPHGARKDGHACPTPAEIRRGWAERCKDCVETLLLHPDHHGPTEILFPPQQLPKARRDQLLPRVLARCGVVERVLGSFACLAPSARGSLLVDLATTRWRPEASSECAMPQITDCTIRDNSMAFVTLDVGNDEQAIARIPLHQESVEELQRIAGAYLDMERSVPQLRRLMPQAAPLHSIHGWPVHLESRIKGAPIRTLIRHPETRSRARRLVLDFVNELCRATREERPVDENFDELHFGVRIRSLCTEERVHADDLMRVRSEALERLAGATMATVRIHGDLTVNNVLVDPSSHRINGVIDWETSLPGSLPFDMVHYLISERRDVDPQPWGAHVAQAVAGRLFDPEADILLDIHLESLGMARQQLIPLLIAYWLRGVALRQKLSGGKLEPTWREQNFAAPLAAIKQVLAATG